MSWCKLTLTQRGVVLNNFKKYLQNKFPGFDIVDKKKSLRMIFLSRVLFFVPGFMKNFTTVSYPIVYTSSLAEWHANPDRAIVTLAHEYVHLRDRKRLGLFFNFLYMTPQALFVFALLYPYSDWFLLFLFCLLPFPSLGRTWAEIRAYKMTMAVFYWLYGVQYSVDHIVHQFVSPNYYWMFPFPGFIRTIFSKHYTSLVQDKLSPEFREIKNVLTATSVYAYNDHQGA
jgi:hypothetical protein